MSTQYISFDVGTRNMAYCVACKTEDAMRITHWDNVDIKGTSAKHTTTALMALLDRIFFEEMMDDVPTVVLVESQPNRVAQIIRTLQVYIMAYFDIVAKYQGRPISTRTVSPRCKLELTKVETSRAPSLPRQAARRRQYRANKEAAVDAVRVIVERRTAVRMDDRLAQRFLDSKKRDDLADCLLQAMFVANAKQ
jgi:hypothetical protein